ncbi:MAG TPA: hypothetical protein VIQ31_03345, partial [Phormidium sp.]
TYIAKVLDFEQIQNCSRWLIAVTTQAAGRSYPQFSLARVTRSRSHSPHFPLSHYSDSPISEVRPDRIPIPRRT